MKKNKTNCYERPLCDVYALRTGTALLDGSYGSTTQDFVGVDFSGAEGWE